jgi:hypothetical protein
LAGFRANTAAVSNVMVSLVHLKVGLNFYFMPNNKPKPISSVLVSTWLLGANNQTIGIIYQPLGTHLIFGPVPWRNYI